MPGHSYKGDYVGAGQAMGLTAPGLTIQGTSNLNWTWTGTNPVSWQTWHATGGPFTLLATNAGTLRTRIISPTAGVQYFVVGVDAQGNRVTRNSVIITHP